MHDVGSAKNIICGYTIEICKDEQVLHRDGLIAAFIAGINRLTGVQQVRNLRLKKDAALYAYYKPIAIE